MAVLCWPERTEWESPVVNRLFGNRGSGLGVRRAIKRVLRGSEPEPKKNGQRRPTVEVADLSAAAESEYEPAPATEPSPAEEPDTVGQPILNLIESEPEEPSAEPEPAPAPSGFAAAARSASASGVNTGVTFRLAAPGQGTEGAATNDVIIGQDYDTEIREAEDGASYWGPIDNDSARAKAAGDTLDIDRDECIGCGTCVEHIDTVFFLNDDEGKAYVIAQEGAMDRIDDAIDACPVTCISWL